MTANALQPASLWRDALLRLRHTWVPMLALHLFFALAGIVIFVPLLGLVLRLLLLLSGEPALADQDIARFLLSPAGFAAFVVFAALAIGIIAFEQAGMMRIALGRTPAGSLRTVDALSFTFSRVYSVYLFAAHLVARLLLIILPALAIGAVIAWWLISDYDINYYLAEKPAEFLLAALLLAFLIAGMVVVLVLKLVAWSLALPLVVFDSVSPRRSFAESAALTEGHRSSILGSIALWALSSFLIASVVLAIVWLVADQVVPAVSGDLSLLLVALGLISALLAAANLLATAVTSGHFATLLTRVYESRAAPAGAGPDFDGGTAHRTFHLTPARLAIGLLIALSAAIVSAHWLLDDIQTEDDIVVIAHRGAAGRAPENTLAAVRAAIEDRADWVEIDVQETLDGEVVVVHDSDFMKLAGDPTKVWRATFEQLSDIDVGSWFGSEFATERVPTLRDVLDMARGQAHVVIELKYYGHDERLEARVAEVVEAADMTDGVAIMSLKYKAVQKMKRLRPGWDVGLLSATAIGDLSKMDADFLAVSTNMATAGFVRRAHDAGKEVFAWTVNDPVTMSQIISRGVDGIITDEPAMARQVLAERAEMNSVERLLLNAATFFGRDFGTREYRDDSP